MRPFLFLGIALLASGAGVSAAEPQRFASGENRTPLIELYTSEGCSSCPPAERWLGELRDSPGLWRDFVPVAFHVNYWDRLGWPDRFASREGTQREHAYAAAWGGNSVYTPCFVRDGAEWRTQTRSLSASTEKTGVLEATVAGDGICRVKFSPTARPLSGGQSKFDLYVALLGGSLTSRVTAGENRGETLRHEFVVLAFEKHPLPDPAQGGAAEFALPRSKITDVPRRAVAFWITRRDELAPLQSVGGWLQL
ncbi:MAG TPA: DUF1223 domain-containing protein [Opitutaceae bacterium]|nr:DUF1223 domain-containing protein [Opitutaceae bacterium]